MNGVVDFDQIDKPKDDNTNTTFQEMYDFFMAGITDDMFYEMTEEDTLEVLQEILVAAVPQFEFPRWSEPFDLDFVNKTFTTKLTSEEKFIIRQLMIVEWLNQQIANIDLVRQRFSGQEFKFTSQAAHLKQIVALQDRYRQSAYHQQRLYCRRRKNEKGVYKSTFGDLMRPYKNDGRGVNGDDL